MSEDIDKLNDAVRNLNQTVNDLSANLGIFAEVTIKASKGAKAEDEETTKLLNSLGGYRRNLDGLTEAEKSRIEAQRKGAQADAHFKDATDKARQSIGSFATAMLDTNVKLTNMGAVVSGVGDTALALGKSLGGLAQVLGVVIKGFTMLGEASLKQAQSLLTSKDELTKMGGAGAHTTESIRKMARQADLNSETLDRMIKPMKGLGSDIMILGNNAGAAQKEFAELIKATSEEREQMSRLGIDQEQMMQGTADYLALQAASGRSIKNELQDREKLRRASLDYQTNLLDLATLTGKDVATLKEKQKEAALDAQRQIKDMADQIKIDDLRKQGRTDEANQIKKEMDARNAALDALVDAPEALRKGAKEMIITGTISGESAKTLARNNMQGPLAELAKTIQEGGDPIRGAAKLQDEYNENQKNRLRSSERALLVSEQARKDFDFENLEDNKKRSQRLFTNMEEEYGKAKAKRTAGQQPGQDTAADARAKLQEGVIKTTGALDDIVAATNPLIGEFTLLKGATVALTAAAGAATVVLGGLALKAKAGDLLSGAKTGGAAGGTGILDTLKGLLGSKDKTMPGTGAGSIRDRAKDYIANAESNGINRADARKAFFARERATVAPTVAAKPPIGAASGGAAGIVQGLGQGGGNMLESAAKGLAAFANPKVTLGAAGFGTAIAAVGAGIAGATWIMGKALPSLAEGLTSFEKIDGDKLIKTGKGVAALGGGLAVFGAGGAAAGFGAIASSISEGLLSFFGGKTPFQKIEEFSKLDIDADKVKSNAEAFSAFSTAMAKAGGGTAAAGIGSAVGAVGDAITGLFKGKSSFDKLKEFAKLDLGTDGAKKIKDNAEAFAAFSDAMSKYKGTSVSTGSAISQSISDFFKVTPPIDQLQKFSSIDFGEGGAKKIKDNAEAFGVFADAMSKYKGMPSDSVGSAINKSVTEFFGVEPPVAQMQKFAAINLGDGAAKKVKENAQAFVYFSKAMAEYKGAAGDGIGSAINKSVSDFFNIEPPVEKMQKFAAINLGEDGAKKLKANAEAFGIFADAMNKYKGEAASGGLISGINKSINSFFEIEPPISQMQKFAAINLGEDGAKKLKTNAEAFGIFADAMSKFKGEPASGGLMAGINKSVSSFFEIDPPVDKMLKFSQIDLGEGGAKKVKENAQAFVYFSKAMSEYKGDATDSISSMLASSASEFFNADPPTAKLVKFSELKINPETVKKNSDAFVLFSNAMASYKGGGELKNIADNIVGGINKFFGGDSVVDKFVKFTKLDVDPEKAGKLATAFARYAKGIQVLQGGGGAPSGGGGATAAPAAAAPAAAAKPSAPSGGGAAPTSAAPVAAKSSSGGSTGGGFMSTVASALGFGGKDSGDASKTPDASSATPVAAKPAGKGGQMSEQDIKDMIIAHEGIRYEPYKDSLGLWTVGVGHLIGDGRSLPPEYNRRFSHEEVMAMFDKDYEKHKRQAQSNVPSFSKYDSMGQAAFIDLTFNMGPGWPKKFPNTIKAVAAGDTEKAARGLEDSLWYQQVKSRGPKIVSMVENSTVQARDGGLAMGPETGYPATLHGNEMIVPLDPNSILAELGKKSQSQVQSEIVEKTNQIEGMNPEVFAELANINKAMMDMMASKLDAVINRLETGNDTQDKLLKYSQA